MIPLVKDTINEHDIDQLCDWLKTYPRLTKGDKTLEFERKWSEYLGVKHSIFVNSGSSANLGIISVIQQQQKLRNNKVVVPAISWCTTVTPVIQLGFDPILCDCNMDNLGVDVEHLKRLFIEHNPSMLVIVHVLGMPCDMDEIVSLCQEYDVILVEDSCESVGSFYKGKKTGTFGLCSSFSFYFGHHISTIEGGMICTDDDELAEVIKSIRCHGWDRDLKPTTQQLLREHYEVDNFQALYTFYWNGFNFRSTDLQAFIGLNQIDKWEIEKDVRVKNFELYNYLIHNDFWKPKTQDDVIVNNFAYPILSPKRDAIVDALVDAKIECRPLICGSIGLQPFWIKQYGRTHLPNANKINKYGLYVPNSQQLEHHEVIEISNVVNSVINK